MPDRSKLALLTGASAGIGEALAHRIAADGYDLVLVARRAERLEALAAALPTAAHPVPLDLTEPDAGERLAARLAGLGRPVDVLVNNAGFGGSAPFREIERERQLAMIDLNIRALVELTHRFLPAMLTARSGGVLNVASTAAFQPGPGMAVYYASKAFVLSFSEALWQECRGTGVTISALCPGPTQSEFTAVAGMERSRLFRYAQRMGPQEVAQVGWRGFKAGRRVVIPGTMNKLTAAASRITPHRVLLPVVRLLQSDH